MPITAKNTAGTTFEPVPAGNHAARCIQMIEIGTVETDFQGQKKKQHKVRLGFELPNELKVFKEENGEQPAYISKSFTLSMHEKSNLRKFLESWRGKAFTEEQCEAFDVTVLVGAPCFLNVIHKENEKTGKTYAEISSISPPMKGFTMPAQINPSKVLSYDNFDWDIFNALPEYYQKEMAGSDEYIAMTSQHVTKGASSQAPEPVAADDDDLPF